VVRYERVSYAHYWSRAHQPSDCARPGEDGDPESLKFKPGGAGCPKNVRGPERLMSFSFNDPSIATRNCRSQFATAAGELQPCAPVAAAGITAPILPPIPNAPFSKSATTMTHWALSRVCWSCVDTRARVRRETFRAHFGGRARTLSRFFCQSAHCRGYVRGDQQMLRHYSGTIAGSCRPQMEVLDNPRHTGLLPFDIFSGSCAPRPTFVC
jgi:hypothetical protein